MALTVWQKRRFMQMRRRQESLPWSLSVLSGVFFLAMASAICFGYGDSETEMAGVEAHGSPTSRQLQQLMMKDIFTHQEKLYGAIILHFIFMIYCFIALAIVCDEYFVASLEVITEKLQLSDDVAGATFMAAGGSAPELATSMMAVFVTSDDTGFGTIVGSAVFNVLFVIGMCAFFSGQVLQLTWYPLFRDCIFYVMGLLALVVCIWDQTILWWEALILFMMYFVYVGMMSQDPKIKVWAYRTFGSKRSKVQPAEIAEAAAATTSAAAAAASAPNGETKEATTAHAGGAGTDPDMARRHSFHHERRSIVQQVTQHHSIGQGVHERKNKVEGGENNWTDKPKEAAVPEAPEDDDGPKSVGAKIYYFASVPLLKLFQYTIPDCSEEGNPKLFPVTFFMSIAWIAVATYFMVQMAQMIGDTFFIPPEVMGITILAAGTSIPDALSSVIVAQEGHGDMAVSSSIGSNIFDILVGLPVPWLLKTGVVEPGTTAVIKATGLALNVIVLLFMVIATIASIHFSGWVLTKKLGYILVFLYVIFVTQALLVSYVPAVSEAVTGGGS